MDYKRINNLTGWGVFLFALLVYLLSMSPTASFWDCGEFIACSNELEVPHPPGAPFFLLIGRIFAMFAFGDPMLVAFMLNIMSVLSSAFTVLFTFWITTILGRRLILNSKETPNQTQTLVIMAAGVVGAMACTFADSFWFNAVEAEVYALSSFFTAIVVWLMLKWEGQADQPGNERWIILIAYLMGLSIGVHLLNLLTVPALAFIYYFRKYDFSWLGFFITGVISVAILGIIQTGVILYTFDLAWWFETIFVGVIQKGGITSGMGLPMGTGVIVFFILLFGALGYGIYYTHQKNMPTFNTALLSLLVVYIGFSSYLMIPIRSNANPPIDENNPDNTQTFLSYMKREQYGNRPLFSGALYNAQPVGVDNTGTEYILEEGKDRYTAYGNKRTYRYAPGDIKLFPRMYEGQRWDPNKFGPHAYRHYVKRKGGSHFEDRPTSAEDFRFFLNYQINHMYIRYFMWNFAGKEGDIQDQGWESGLSFGKTAKMPQFMKDDPGKNHYYALPLLLGLLGLFWQAYKRGKDASIIGLLFFFTGIAIIIYLNQYPMQPRERDYSFAGSFQTFAIWIGLGVIALFQLLEQYLGKNAAIVATVIGLIPPLIMGFENWDDHSRAGRYVAPDSAYNLLNSLEKNAVLFTNGDNDTFPLWYAQEVEGVRPDVRVLCLSYVNTDWYIDQMFQLMNESAPLPLSLEKKDYVGQAKQSVSFGARKNFPFSVAFEPQHLTELGLIDEDEATRIQQPMSWNVPTRGGANNKYLELKDILLLNLVQGVAKGEKNEDGSWKWKPWERPVYFANTVTPSNFIGMAPYLRLEGLAYRILPLRYEKNNDPYDPFEGHLDLERMFTNMSKFRYRNLDEAGEGVYYDENIRRMIGNYHNTFYRLANGYLRKAEGIEATNKRLKSQLEANPALADSVNSVMEANQTVIDQTRARARETMDLTEKFFPYTIAAPDPYMIARSGIMWDRLGDREKMQEYFTYAEERALNTLQYYSTNDDYFPKATMYRYPIQMMEQYYRQEGMNEESTRLREAIQQLSPRLLK